MNLDDTEIEKYKFHQYKRLISIDNREVNKQYLIKSFLVKIILNILLDTKMLKNLYAYFFQKWVHIKEILIKLNKCLFW